MPFSFHCPRFLRTLRFGHSRSRPPKSTADACDDTGVSSAGLDISHALFRPTPGPSEQDVDAAPCVTRLPVSGNPIGSTDSLTRAPVDFGGQPSSASRPVTPTVPILSSHDSVVQPGIQLTPRSDDTHSAQAQQYLAPPRSSYGLATPSQRSFHAETINPLTGQDLQQQRHQNPGMFNQAHNLSVTGNFIDGNVGSVTYISTPSDPFMEKLLEKTIPGAASDSSARDPPPQCHPGTRLAILERCIHFVTNCTGKKKIRWVVGFAGVGKSAIMQSVADSPNLPVTCHVSIFFSINGRNDGTKAIITLSYQLAVKSASYCQIIEHEIAHDPSLLRSSIRVQFERLIINPFIHNPQLSSAHRIVIIIDGLDECNNKNTQLELLRLISDFCIKYPSSPLVWLIASRPESHITSFFARADVMPAYEKEEIQVDSDDSRADVERFLREKLEEIKGGSNSFDPQSKWPEEKDFLKLAKAAGGLFAYADTAIKYIGDLNVGNPVSQFSDVLKVIDNHPVTGILREEHPMALLDALYAQILSNVPAKVIEHTRKLILSLASNWDFALQRGTFVELCNWLGMTPDEAYAAVNQLQSLLRTPKRDQAHLEKLEPFHKSFIDYVSDSSRSNFFTDMNHEAQQLETECAFRVLNEAPDGIDFGDVDYEFFFGTLRRGPGTGDKISLTWPVDGRGKNMQLNLYKMAIVEIVEGFRKGDPTFMTEFCIRLLITQVDMHNPFLKYLRGVFDESRRDDFMRWSILKQVPLKAVPGIPKTHDFIRLRFRRPAQAVAPGFSTAPNAVELSSHRPTRAGTSFSDPWKSSCKHEREGEWEEGKDQDWRTDVWNVCNFCQQRLERQVKSIKTRSPGHTVTVLFTYTGDCCVELRFVDPDDGISEWTYWVWIKLSPEERKELGSTSPAGQDLQQQRQQNPGMFNRAPATGNIIGGNSSISTPPQTIVRDIPPSFH
ncbi:hypothetical protein AGABI1DRAFT_130983 [Agaricus bisporus var. burnettii JB137-S8]|uniref:Nephrocystin 3-like N-terminal domain-containing protein n=1 Tax=Agaricus bisporus var. burnettii (strain JB137-S8 / ATCC MYA-4627 / FGSC 10392) TaxID=597362 RepID=K5X0Q5_AGABU|nr:uncharacterized protein AGABI1DRAFT_130983 [Agaricus bisporus var. burnettii JB137-S8]EKM76688.1 hypothetical protein AGABI1DRAFT_130983 [Agaricus bisporus var. burnettii JB137-S8]